VGSPGDGTRTAHEKQKKTNKKERPLDVGHSVKCKSGAKKKGGSHKERAASPFKGKGGRGVVGRGGGLVGGGGGIVTSGGK